MTIRRSASFLSVLFLLVPEVRVDGQPAAGDLEAAVARMTKIGACFSPSFSPDGTEIAFVSNLSGLPQVWVVAAAGGWPRQVTAFDDPVGAVQWSPDGAWLAFSLAPGGGLNTQLYVVRPDGREPRLLTKGGKTNNWLGPWSRDGRSLTFSSNRRSPDAMDSYLLDLERRGEPRLVAQNAGIGSVTDRSRDGRRYLVARVESRSDDNLFLVEPEAKLEVLLTPHQPPGSFLDGRFSPDGRTVYLGSNAERDRIAFARVRLDADGAPGRLELLAARDDAELESFEISDDGSTAVLVWNAGGRSELAFLDLATGAATPGPPLPADLLGSILFSRDGTKLVFNLAGSNRPSDVWVLERAGGRLTQVTHSPHPGVDLDALVRPELVRFPAQDGLELSGWLYRPPGVSGPAPYVLSFHGGPEGQERPSFRADYQALLARGIGVFAPNVRGSAGFGKRFVNLDNGALRVGAVKDIQAAADYLVGKGIAARGRLGIMGGSYGGYMTMAGLSVYPDLFAAGANLFGVVNFETFFAHTEGWMAAISTVEYGDPKTQLAMLRDLSPIHQVDRVKAPTIVLHGANDTNVPVVEAEQVVASLKGRGVPVEYVLFPDEGHGFRKLPNRLRANVAVVRWFEEHLTK
ncbi:MAG TPA: S9 family peptidase [Thermoanaerobaculia bacterium]